MKVTLVLAAFLAICFVQYAAGQEDRCSHTPGVVGPCRALIPRYTFYASSNQCELFHYGGCKGNDNNFVTKAGCEATCVS
ncbi:U-actitoxin-Avd3s [Holothuria leucospilota]|uniref:U-actitoxin-Avd3s n=1 Tax=Holothuria leucospilota TaxID=206669 RepID=A0A9Q1C3E0_HOLLE|nr:U-actitoxin-Avd3s [Holothuria leucospilota]